MAPPVETRTWRSDIAVRAEPDEVLEVLTDIEACESWSPVRFEVEDLESRRLRTGTSTQVSGRLLGRRVGFRVKVFQADSERLLLRASGPVEIRACYVVGRASHGSCIEATITVRRKDGYANGLAAHATSILLSAGALNHALAGIAREAERRHR